MGLVIQGTRSLHNYVLDICVLILKNWKNENCDYINDITASDDYYADNDYYMTGQIPLWPKLENSTPKTLDLHGHPYSKSYALYYHRDKH